MDSNETFLEFRPQPPSEALPGAMPEDASPLAGALFRCIRNKFGILKGQICTHTGVVLEQPRRQEAYEMDFGVGWVNGHSPLHRKNMGHGYFMTMEQVRESCVEYDPQGKLPLKRPGNLQGSITEIFWGIESTRQFRLCELHSRINRYCGAVAWQISDRRTAEEDNYETVPLYTSALLSGYASLSSWPELGDIPQGLYAALHRGRAIYPDQFGNALYDRNSNYMQSAVRQAAAGGDDLGEEEVAAPGGVLFLVGTAHEPSGDCGVFPHIASYNLCAVYGKLRAWPKQRGVEPGLDYGYATLSGAGAEGQLSKDELVSALDELWRPFAPTRDWITRFAHDTGFNGMEWALIGIRVHRKCYGHALRGKFAEYYIPEENNDPDEFAIPKGIVVAENGYVRKEIVAENGYVREKFVTRDAWLRLQELQPEGEDNWREVGAGDVQLVEHFTFNMRKLCRQVLAMDYKDVADVAPEYSVYWPFGLFAKTRGEIGRAYETRVDLLVQGTRMNSSEVAPDPSLLLVEYKTRMELTHGAKAIYALRNANDRLQLRLNTWMIYLCTGLQVRHAYVIQASRRLDGEDGVLGCFGRLSMGDGEIPWADSFMVNIITRFALKPFGGNSLSRYADRYFVVPDMVALLEAFCFSHAKIKTNPDGTHDIFASILRGSEFSRKLRNAMFVAGPEENETTVEIGLPDACFMHPRSPNKISARVATSLCGPLNRRLQPLKLRTTFAEKWSTVGESIVTGNAASADRRLFHPHHACFASIALDQQEDTAGSSLFVPLLFSGDKVILYCATRLQAMDPIELVVVSPPALAGESLAPIPSSMVALPGNLPIFRPSAGTVQLNRRLWRAEDLTADNPVVQAQAEVCEEKRRQLHLMVKQAAAGINSRLVEARVIDKVPAKRFWEFSIGSIHRRHVLPTTESPVVREFAPFGDEPYAAPPTTMDELTEQQQDFWRLAQRPRRNNRLPQLPSALATRLVGFRLQVTERCLHRLLNTRLLRASLAFVGLDDVDVSRVVQGDGEEAWSDEELIAWRKEELRAAVEQLGMDPTMTRDGPEGGSWWQSTTNRPDGASRRMCFPHMSQKAMWSEDTFAAITATLTMATGNRNLVQLAADHIFEDLRNACDAYDPTGAHA